MYVYQCKENIYENYVNLSDYINLIEIYFKPLTKYLINFN